MKKRLFSLFLILALALVSSFGVMAEVNIQNFDGTAACCVVDDLFIAEYGADMEPFWGDCGCGSGGRCCGGFGCGICWSPCPIGGPHCGIC